MAKSHRYHTTIEWTGNRGTGTSAYGAYGRDYTVKMAGKADLLGSADPAFRGDPQRTNPEELLLAAIAACHQLWYLHLCADAGIVVTAYVDNSEALMDEGNSATPGRFLRATLRPRVTITAAEKLAQAQALHREAHRLCFIANSLNFPVECEPEIVLEG